MKILLRQTLFETKFFLRRRDDLFWTLAFPVFFMVLFGLIYGDEMWGDIRAIDYILAGIVVLALMTTGIMTSATSFAEDREKGIYRRLSVTPLKKQIIIGSQILNRYVIILVQTLILLIIGVLAFNINITGNYALFWFVLTIGALCFLSIGFALTSLMWTAKSATPLAMIVFFILMFLGGVFFPIDIMPTGLGYISKGLPSTHLNDALRMIAVEGKGIGDIWIQLLAVIGWMVGCLAVSMKFFRWE